MILGYGLLFKGYYGREDQVGAQVGNKLFNVSAKNDHN